jgi:hypothetical protein
MKQSFIVWAPFVFPSPSHPIVSSIVVTVAFLRRDVMVVVAIHGHLRRRHFRR